MLALRNLPPDLSDADVPAAVREMEVPPGPRAAVFDADGVLWRGDVSEDFTRWMIERGEFDGALWADYERVNAADPAAGCLFILRFYEGRPRAAIARAVDEFWREAAPRRWLRRCVATVGWAARSGFEVLVVSATPAPVLRPLEEQRELPVARVLALELETDGAGRYTGAAGPGTATIGAGKAERIAEATDAPVLLAAGNSALDLWMLRLSRGVAWAVEPDEALSKEAETSGWLITEENA